MEIHHGKHHQAYVTNLNNAITGTDAEKMSIDDICKNISKNCARNCNIIRLILNRVLRNYYVVVFKTLYLR